MGFTNVTRLEGGIVSYSKFAKERGLESKFKVQYTVSRCCSLSYVGVASTTALGVAGPCVRSLTIS